MKEQHRATFHYKTILDIIAKSQLVSHNISKTGTRNGQWILRSLDKADSFINVNERTTCTSITVLEMMPTTYKINIKKHKYLALG